MTRSWLEKIYLVLYVEFSPSLRQSMTFFTLDLCFIARKSRIDSHSWTVLIAMIDYEDRAFSTFKTVGIIRTL